MGALTSSGIRTASEKGRPIALPAPYSPGMYSASRAMTLDFQRLILFPEHRLDRRIANGFGDHIKLCDPQTRNG